MGIFVHAACFVALKVNKPAIKTAHIFHLPGSYIENAAFQPILRHLHPLIFLNN